MALAGAAVAVTTAAATTKQSRQQSCQEARQVRGSHLLTRTVRSLRSMNRAAVQPPLVGRTVCDRPGPNPLFGMPLDLHTDCLRARCKCIWGLHLHEVEVMIGAAWTGVTVLGG